MPDPLLQSLEDRTMWLQMFAAAVTGVKQAQPQLEAPQIAAEAGRIADAGLKEFAKRLSRAAPTAELL